MKAKNIIVGWFAQYNGTDKDGNYKGIGQVVGVDIKSDIVQVQAPGEIVNVPAFNVVKIGYSISDIINQSAMDDFLATHEPDKVIS